MWSVTFGRTSLSLAPLVIDGNPHTGSFHLTEEDCGWPSFSMRRTYAPESDEVGGSTLLKAAPDLGNLPLRIVAHDANMTALRAAMLELEAATSQFTYDLTLVVGGVTIGTYEAHAEFPQWGALDSGNVRAAINEATIVIPLNPLAGA